MKKSGKKNILLVEDDELFQQAMKDYLQGRYGIRTASSVPAATKILKEFLPDLVLLDITLPGTNGIELLKIIKSSLPELPVVMLTALDHISKVVECIKLGASDYLTKPIIVEELLASLDRAMEGADIRRELKQRRHLQLATNKEYLLVGDSPAMGKIRSDIQLLARGDSSVLIEGETGTGKELVARQIHALSDRAAGPFVAINCSAIPRDLFESEFFGYKKGAYTGADSSEIGKLQLAHTGTLLLDEIGELPLTAQAKFLRVLEEQEFYPVGGNQLVRVDVRIIASTNRSLSDMVQNKQFRDDLYFRLNTYTIPIPPLRERIADILPLVTYFLNKYNHKFGREFSGISPEAKTLLMKHPWKGNVRELRNLIERVVLSHQDKILQKHHLQFLPQMPETESDFLLELPESGICLDELEKTLIQQALERTGGNKTKAAKLLSLSAPTFYYRLEKYGLQ